jgi:CHAD domain-containing protein
VRLARDAIGSERARGENAALRDAARRIADVRDSAVLLERLEELGERFGHELTGSDLHGLHAALRIERDRAAERLRNDPHRVGLFVEQLRQARERVASWDLGGGGYDAVAPGLRRIYARGRRAFATAATEPSVEALHEWRKRVKDLRHAAEVLRDRERTTLRPVVKRSKRLADLLGEDHDLALLRERAVATPALVGVIDRRRGELREAALRLGARLYRRKPKAFVNRVRRRWRDGVNARHSRASSA